MSALAGKKAEFSYLKSIKTLRNPCLESPFFFEDVFRPPGHEIRVKNAIWTGENGSALAGKKSWNYSPTVAKWVGVTLKPTSPWFFKITGVFSCLLWTYFFLFYRKNMAVPARSNCEEQLKWGTEWFVKQARFFCWGLRYHHDLVFFRLFRGCNSTKGL